MLREVFRFVYMVIPITDPLSERRRQVALSLRTEVGDWQTLLTRAGYTLVVLAFFYLLSTLGLRRRNLS